MITYSVTDLRQKTSDVIATAMADGYVHIIQNSKPKVAVVDSEYLSALQEAYENQLDVEEFDRVKDDPPFISLDEYLTKHPLE